MNVLLMGDSWGKGDLEYLLLKNNHCVFNKSWFGGSNSNTLHDGIRFIECSKHFIKMDLIIWFQTEYIRDIRLVTNLSMGYKNALEEIHNRTYQQLSTIKEISPNSKWVIIGGHAPIYNPESYAWADLLITDWRSELLNKKLPFCHAISYDILSDLKKIFGIEVLEEELIKFETILKAVQNCPELFPDGTHPNEKCCEQLYKKIMNLMLYNSDITIDSNV